MCPATLSLGCIIQQSKTGVWLLLQNHFTSQCCISVRKRSPGVRRGRFSFFTSHYHWEKFTEPCFLAHLKLMRPKLITTGHTSCLFHINPLSFPRSLPFHTPSSPGPPRYWLPSSLRTQGPRTQTLSIILMYIHHCLCIIFLSFVFHLSVTLLTFFSPWISFYNLPTW